MLDLPDQGFDFIILIFDASKIVMIIPKLKRPIKASKIVDQVKFSEFKAKILRILKENINGNLLKNTGFQYEDYSMKKAQKPTVRVSFAGG